MIEDFRAILTGASAVAGLTGSRIYPLVCPQGTDLPAAVIQGVSGRRDYHMAGETDLRERRVQVDAYGRTYAASNALADAIASALSGFSGTQGGTEFQGIFLEQERDFFDPAKEETSRVHRRSMDFMVKYRSI